MRYSNKYYNIKTRTTDGETFDSTLEAKRWEQLLILQRAGKITDLKRQVRFELLPNQYETRERYSAKSGKRLKDEQILIERKVDYIADFTYSDTETGMLVVEDTKSKITKTPDFIIKKKLMYAIHGIKIKIVEKV